MSAPTMRLRRGADEEASLAAHLRGASRYAQMRMQHGIESVSSFRGFLKKWAHIEDEYARQMLDLCQTMSHGANSSIGSLSDSFRSKSDRIIGEEERDVSATDFADSISRCMGDIQSSIVNVAFRHSGVAEGIAKVSEKLKSFVKDTHETRMELQGEFRESARQLAEAIVAVEKSRAVLKKRETYATPGRKLSVIMRATPSSVDGAKTDVANAEQKAYAIYAHRYQVELPKLLHEVQGLEQARYVIVRKELCKLAEEVRNLPGAYTAFCDAAAEKCEKIVLEEDLKEFVSHFNDCPIPPFPGDVPSEFSKSEGDGDADGGAGTMQFLPRSSAGIEELRQRAIESELARLDVVGERSDHSADVTPDRSPVTSDTEGEVSRTADVPSSRAATDDPAGSEGKPQLVVASSAATVSAHPSSSASASSGAEDQFVAPGVAARVMPVISGSSHVVASHAAASEPLPASEAAPGARVPAPLPADSCTQGSAVAPPPPAQRAAPPPPPAQRVTPTPPPAQRAAPPPAATTVQRSEGRSGPADTSGLAGASCASGANTAAPLSSPSQTMSQATSAGSASDPINSGSQADQPLRPGTGSSPLMSATSLSETSGAMPAAPVSASSRVQPKPPDSHNSSSGVKSAADVPATPPSTLDSKNAGVPDASGTGVSSGIAGAVRRPPGAGGSAPSVAFKSSTAVSTFPAAPRDTATPSPLVRTGDGARQSKAVPQPGEALSHGTGGNAGGEEQPIPAAPSSEGGEARNPSSSNTGAAKKKNVAQGLAARLAMFEK